MVTHRSERVKNDIKLYMYVIQLSFKKLYLNYVSLFLGALYLHTTVSGKRSWLMHMYWTSRGCYRTTTGVLLAAVS